MGVLRRLKKLQDYHLQAQDGEIGDLREVYFDDHLWTVRYLVVRTGGWLLGREVLIAPRSVTGVIEERKALTVNLSKEQIKGSPSVMTEEPVSRHYERVYYQYYDWIPYWYEEPFLAPDLPPVPAELPEQRSAPPENPHLRSSHEVRGYHLHATNGQIGHVADFILDQQDWRIRYLEIDTRNWWPGKHVLIDPMWIRCVSWETKEIAVSLAREAIEGAPEYESAQLISPDYELRLHQHYGFSSEQK